MAIAAAASDTQCMLVTHLEKVLAAPCKEHIQALHTLEVPLPKVLGCNPRRLLECPEAKAASTDLRRDWLGALRRELLQLRRYAVEVLCFLGFGRDLAQELEAALFAQLPPERAAEICCEALEESLHVRRCRAFATARIGKRRRPGSLAKQAGALRNLIPPPDAWQVLTPKEAPSAARRDAEDAEVRAPKEAPSSAGRDAEEPAPEAIFGFTAEEDPESDKIEEFEEEDQIEDWGDDSRPSKEATYDAHLEGRVAPMADTAGSWDEGWLFCAGAEEVLRGPGRAVSQPPVRAEVHAGPKAEHATIQQPEVGPEDSEVPEGRWHSAPEAGDVPPTTLGGFSWGHVGGHVSEGPKEEFKDISVELQPEIAVGGGLPDLIGGNESQKCAEPKRPAEAAASPLEPPATKRRADPDNAKAEIARILQVPEQQPEWGLEALGLQPPPEGAEAAVRAAAKAFRSMARKIHPDGRQRLTEEDELRCHEALAKLQRARRAVHRLVGCVPFKAPRRPELLECRAMGPAIWRFTWKVSPTESSRPVTRYELRAEDGGFFVTIAEVDPSAAAGGFELKEEQLSSRIRTSLHATGCLRVRVAAVGRGGVASSEEVAVRLAEGGEGTAATQTQTSTCAKRKMKDVFW